MWNQMLLISCVAVRAPAIATMSHSASKQRECFINRKPRWHIYKHAVAGGERYPLPQRVLFYRSIYEITVKTFLEEPCCFFGSVFSNENELLDFLRQRESSGSCPAVFRVLFGQPFCHFSPSHRYDNIYFTHREHKITQ